MTSFHFTPRVARNSLLLLCAIALAITTWNLRSASAADVNHGTVVPETPRRDTPIVADGKVYATIQMHDRVIVAGNFTTVERRNGTTVGRTHIFAYDINSGALIEDYNPVLDGEVRAVIGDEDTGDIFIGGKFKTIDGTTRLRVAKLDWNGAVDPVFDVAADASVRSLELGPNTLWLGGNFETLDGVRHARIGAVDATTGRVDDTFAINVEGVAGKAGSNTVRALDLHPDGNRLLVAHNGDDLVGPDGPHAVAHTGLAIIDVRDNSVTPWRTDWFRLVKQWCSLGALQIQDAEFSPDGSFFVAVEKGGFRCDKVVAFNTADDGAGNDPKWVTSAHDSVYSVGISDAAVYIGGHFCFIRDYGPVDAQAVNQNFWFNKPTGCVSGGNTSVGEFDARHQIAALDPQTGAALDWNPKTNAQEATFDIELIDRGLLLGMDRDRINDIRTGRHAFLDFGGVTPPFEPPVDPTPSCTASLRGDGNVELSWNDLPGVGSWSVRKNGSWLATVQDDTTHVDVQPDAGAHTYSIRHRLAGAVVETTCQPDPIVIDDGPGNDPLTCTATVLGNGNVRVEWNDIGANRYIVRRDGSWRATVTTTSYDDAPAAAQHTYLVRVKIDGVNTDVTCTPDPVVIDGGNGPDCSVAAAAGGRQLSWDAVAGVDSWQVRRNGSWVATTNQTSYLDADGAAGDTWEIRYRLNGDRQSINCG